MQVFPELEKVVNFQKPDYTSYEILEVPKEQLERGSDDEEGLGFESSGFEQTCRLHVSMHYNRKSNFPKDYVVNHI